MIPQLEHGTFGGLSVTLPVKAADEPHMAIGNDHEAGIFGHASAYIRVHRRPTTMIRAADQRRSTQMNAE